jgi:glycosyltransferase involved in cell wall biosynthesis
MNLPKVTILIANYNDEDYLDRCIESAVNQDYPGYLNICIVDDGSTDGSWEIIQSYFDDKDGDLLKKKRTGRFGYTDLIAIKSKNGGGSIGVVYGDYDVVHTSTGKIIREYKEPYNRRRLVRECIVHSGSLILKDALVSVEEDTGFYDEEMRTCEDYDLWMRISEKYIIAHVPKSLTKVRVTGDNSSFIVNQEVWQKNWARVMEKMQARINGQ